MPTARLDGLRVDGDRLARELDTLAAFSDAPAPAVTRVVFGETDRKAREYVTSLCAEASLAVRTDAVGNTFARWRGTSPDLPAVATGSHIDAIPNAGRFDGTVGVLGGLEAIRALQRGFTPRRSIELVLFTSEEPTRFGIGCLGSRLLSGALDPVVDDTLRDADQGTLKACRTAAGFSGALASVRLSEGTYSAFVELHIEQGPLLEAEKLDIGVVTAIAAPASLRIHIEGQGGHAGAVLMPDRHDAFLAGAEIALAVEAAARATGSIDTVGTVGVCHVFPGAVNSVPSRTTLEVDVRDIERARRDDVLSAILEASQAIAARRGVTVRVETLNADPPAICAPAIVGAVTSACQAHAVSHRTMISRAYHDSLFMARVAPTGMIFIPCRGGVSHRPDEYASPAAIANGTAVLARTLAALAHRT
ncbi:MAG TPA: M20 family metallo-hydrolase [Vicinamibacterales bacterium]|nr:M20 family metallo-hydrolase [Vicinamibacterales bacterium]